MQFDMTTIIGLSVLGAYTLVKIVQTLVKTVINRKKTIDRKSYLASDERKWLQELHIWAKDQKQVITTISQINNTQEKTAFILERIVNQLDRITDKIDKLTKD